MASYEQWEGKVEADVRPIMHRPYDPQADSFGPARIAQPHEMTFAEFSRDPRTLWHGSPAGKMGDGIIHAGSQKAAYEAMCATLIGANASGLDWQPGEPLAKLDAAIEALRAKDERHAKPRQAWMNDPKIFPLWLDPEREHDVRDLADEFPHEQIGDMQDSSDDAANSRIRKNGDEGYFYTNMSEDAGSRSLVVPNPRWLLTHEDFLLHAIEQGVAIDDDVLADYPHLQPRVEMRDDIEHSASVHMRVGDREVGRLTLNWSPASPDRPKIVGVKISPAWRRRGIATELFRTAQARWPLIEHNAHTTPEAKAWIASLDRPQLDSLNRASEPASSAHERSTDIGL
jgi:RimJ/RimL family protein N-acetyltransferase